MTNTKRLEQYFENDILIWALDKYADYGVLHLYKIEDEVKGSDNEVNDSELDKVDLSKIKKLSNDLLSKYSLKGIYLKKRYINDPKQTNLTELIAGSEALDEIEVVENDIKFIIRLKDKLDVGLFLDHRLSRELIKSYAKNKDVLNLFSYTSSFSIYSALNGAKSTTSVDLSNTYCLWSQKNFELNNLKVNYNNSDESATNYIWKEDVFDFINVCTETNTTYDIIVLDPPSFSRNKDKVFNIQKDHEDLIRSIQNNLLNPGGFLFFSTNLSNFKLSEYIRPGADKLTKKTIPEEFLPYRPHHSYVFYN